MSLDTNGNMWKLHAACRGEDPSLFYPPDSTAASRRATEKAKRICARCPVRQPCLDAGWGELFGTWGGMSQRERLLARRADYRRDKQWSALLTVIAVQVSVPPRGYDGVDVDPDE